MQQSIRTELLSLVEEDFRIFTAKLTPNINNVMGVRIPLLRKIAKRIVQDSEWEKYLASAKDDFFEETLLQGIVIGYVDVDIDQRLELIRKFVPKINNWSVCDSFCASLKIGEKDNALLWEFLKPYWKSNQAYDIRFAVVMFLNSFISKEYADKVFKILDEIRHEDYYVKMAVAWAVSIYYIKLPTITMPYLKKNQLDDFTHNKALQKIIESLTTNKETKDIIRSMKRKK